MKEIRFSGLFSDLFSGLVLLTMGTIYVSLAKPYGLFFMDGVKLSQGSRATTKKQFTFYHSVPRRSWYSLN